MVSYDIIWELAKNGEWTGEMRENIWKRRLRQRSRTKNAFFHKKKAPAATLKPQHSIFSVKKAPAATHQDQKRDFSQKKAPAATYQDQKHIFHKKGACGSTPGPKTKSFFCRPGAVKLPFKDIFFLYFGAFLGPLGLNFSLYIWWRKGRI